MTIEVRIVDMDGKHYLDIGAGGKGVTLTLSAVPDGLDSAFQTLIENLAGITKADLLMAVTPVLLGEGHGG